MKLEFTTMKKIHLVALFVFTMLLSLNATAQNEKETFPKISGFVAILHPLVTISANETITNFKDYYAVGMPIVLIFGKVKK